MTSHSRETLLRSRTSFRVDDPKGRAAKQQNLRTLCHSALRGNRQPESVPTATWRSYRVLPARLWGRQWDAAQQARLLRVKYTFTLGPLGDLRPTQDVLGRRALRPRPVCAKAAMNMEDQRVRTLRVRTMCPATGPSFATSSIVAMAPLQPLSPGKQPAGSPWRLLLGFSVPLLLCDSQPVCPCVPLSRDPFQLNPQTPYSSGGIVERSCTAALVAVRCARRRATVSTRTWAETGLARNSSAPRARAWSART